MDKYGLAIYNENRVKKRLSTYLDCGGLASVIFPTMKSLDGVNKKNDVNNTASEAPEKNVKTESEKIDFSKVKVEPLFEEFVDYGAVRRYGISVGHGRCR